MRFVAAVLAAILAACTHPPQPPSAASVPRAVPMKRAEAVAPVALARASYVTRPAVDEHVLAPTFIFDVTCLGDCGGTGGWREVGHNTVLTGGGNDLLDKYFKGSAYTAAWYMMLKGAGSINAADTLASHAGWTESTPYSGNRPAITFGTTSARSNTATQVSYTINATATVAGACVSSVATGTSGILYSCTDFAASRSVVSGDTLNVTLTVSD